MILRSGSRNLLHKTILYLIKDEFTTAESAPIASPRTAEPGPGSWTVTQAGTGQFSVSGGKLNIPPQTTSPSFANQHIVSDVDLPDISVVMFVGVIIKVNATQNPRIAVVNTKSSTTDIYIQHRSSYLVTRWGLVYEVPVLNDVHDICYIFFSTVYYMIDRINGGQWILRLAEYYTQTGHYPSIANYNGDVTVNAIYASRLPSPFDADDALNVYSVSGAVSDFSATVLADFIANFTITTRADFVILRFRIETDSQDEYRLTFTASGDVILQEVVGGVVTNRGSYTGVVNGDAIQLRTLGSEIAVYVNQFRRISYTSAIYQDDVDVRLANQTGQISDLKIWHRYLTPEQSNILNRMAQGRV